MDEVTNLLITSFVAFLTKQLLENKEFKAFKKAQIVHWSLKEYRITLDIVHDEKKYKIYFDIRELKDNPTHFSHLVANALDQFKEQATT